MATLVATGKATLRELQDHYSLEDAYNLLEMAIVERANMPKPPKR